jgi:hypothetical protein
LGAGRAVFAGNTGISLIALGALHALYIPRKGLVAAGASRALKAGPDEIHLAVPSSARGDHIARGKCIGAEGEREKERNYN